LPTTADLFRTVTEGVRSTAGAMTIGLRGHRIMPSFRYMPEAQRLEMIEYVKSLNRGFWERRKIKTVAVPAAPPVIPERLSRGKQLYADAECLACHGERGRGDGPSAPTLKDNRDLPIAATDLTGPERFKNGGQQEDIYRTLVTGLAGTPMPSYADSLEPDQAWDLVFYVLSLSRGGRAAEAGGPVRVGQPDKEDDVTKALFVIVAFVICGLVGAGAAVLDEAPISGTVQAIDASANTLRLQTTAKGKMRDVTTKIVKFARATAPGTTGLVERRLTLSDLKPGWVVSVSTKHEAGKEVAEAVQVILEK